MDEFALIDRFFKNRGLARTDVILGIGDDAAVTRIDAGSDLVIATDTIAEGTHFPAGTSPHAVGFRSLAVNLSDLAAMGAEPLWCTLSLTLPSGDANWVAGFAEGFFELANRFNVALIGGDTVRGQLSITVTVHGRTQPGAAIRRNGAAAGDLIYVTGQLGGAGAGLARLQNNRDADDLVKRFLYPAPRVQEGLALVGVASAMIDVSDGLQVDLGRLLAASGVGATLAVEQLPLPADLPDSSKPMQAIELALTGGDDYELCFTVPADQRVIFDSIIESWDCDVAYLGDVHAAEGLYWRAEGVDYVVPDLAFRHFAEETS
jgi:thiamine-monophosphate kinase